MYCDLKIIVVWSKVVSAEESGWTELSLVGESSDCCHVRSCCYGVHELCRFG